MRYGGRGRGLLAGLVERTDRRQQSRDDLPGEIQPLPQRGGQAQKLPPRRGSQQVTVVVAWGARLGEAAGVIGEQGPDQRPVS